ncbi:hypothetical protein PF007_g24797 [Phytophthora fragariae]|uniref:Uncharacterized protein n=1 Tax=Phytophthora fragariae TaxID=53985 RepID=A0A6A3QHR9_9STRA|nr:hypothetical protein PF003_g26704 [Phytophthora fragariae]KAE9075987.1 hypothetical protein PF007_g24797 [Phytophthora fragariae]
MNDTSMKDATALGVATGISLEHASFPHLPLFEWKAYTGSLQCLVTALSRHCRPPARKNSCPGVHDM